MSWLRLLFSNGAFIKVEYNAIKNNYTLFKGNDLSATPLAFKYTLLDEVYAYIERYLLDNLSILTNIKFLMIKEGDYIRETLEITTWKQFKDKTLFYLYSLSNMNAANILEIPYYRRKLYGAPRRRSRRTTINKIREQQSRPQNYLTEKGFYIQSDTPNQQQAASPKPKVNQSKSEFGVITLSKSGSRSRSNSIGVIQPVRKSKKKSSHSIKKRFIARYGQDISKYLPSKNLEQAYADLKALVAKIKHTKNMIYADHHAKKGDIYVFVALESRGFLPNQKLAMTAAIQNQIELLDWMKDRDVYPPEEAIIFAKSNEMFDWLENNGYET